MGCGRRILAVGRAWCEYVLDVVFPPECTACGREGAWVCSSCRRGLATHQNAQCPACGKPSWRGFFCVDCRADSYLSQCIAAFHYSDKRAARMVQTLKYGFVTKSAPSLASCMVRAWKEYGGAVRGLCIPIPLHCSRMKERGFNQAELLARGCSQEIGYTFRDDVLIRTRATPPQAELSREDRKSNIRDAFLCVQPSVVRDTDVVLIDDVYTTCATLQEAARVLKECGAVQVRALTFAHG